MTLGPFALTPPTSGRRCAASSDMADEITRGGWTDTHPTQTIPEESL